MMIETALNDLNLRFADESDVSLILDFIKELAEYEHKLGEVVATEEVLRESLF
jgi:hypothetical protein